MEKNYTFGYKVHTSTSSLSESEQQLIANALEAQERAYAPYSNFKVGAAVLLEDGTVVTGNNQENAAYPSGICAERTAMFYAQSQYPDAKILAVAITAASDKGQTENPITPCGSCRQVLLESERRNGEPFKILFYGTNEVVEIPSATCLLPFSFSL